LFWALTPPHKRQGKRAKGEKVSIKRRMRGTPTNRQGVRFRTRIGLLILIIGTRTGIWGREEGRGDSGKLRVLESTCGWPVLAEGHGEESGPTQNSVRKEENVKRHPGQLVGTRMETSPRRFSVGGESLWRRSGGGPVVSGKKDRVLDCRRDVKVSQKI